MVPPTNKRLVMKPFLTIDEKSRLKLSDLDNKNSKPIIFDINSDYDKSVGSFVAFIKATGFNEFTSSSSLDFPDEYGIDKEILESFFDSVSTTYYEVAKWLRVFFVPLIPWKLRAMPVRHMPLG